MIRDTFEEAFSPERVEKNITCPTRELVLIRKIIPWDAIIAVLTQFYSETSGAAGKSLRIMIALLIISRFRKLSDRKVVEQVRENRYIQYFCNVPDKGLETFLHHSSLHVFRKRIGAEGIAATENEVFRTLLRAGVIRNDRAMTDSTVLSAHIAYPNDVHLIHRAFRKMRAFAKLHGIPLWWDDKELAGLWRKFAPDKKMSRTEWPAVFSAFLIPAPEIFQEKAGSPDTSDKRKKKAVKLPGLLNLPEEQTLPELAGEQHIKDRIVSLDDPDARPIRKGKSHPPCEFGTTEQFAFNGQGFVISAEIFIGNPSDTKLYPETVRLYVKRTGCPGTVVTDLGYRSQANIGKNTPDGVANIFMGKSTDVAEKERDSCRKARSATEGFIAVAKNLRGFGRSLWHGLKGHRMRALLCQTAWNLKKFLQLCYDDKIGRKSLGSLGLA